MSVVRQHHDVIVNCSDQHFGKVNVEQRTGVPAYNSQIAADCVNKLFEALTQTTADLRKQGPLGKLVINQLGDGCDGSNMRPGHALRIDKSIGEQKDDFVASQTAFALKTKKLGYSDVIILFTGDNHGRIGRKLDDDLVHDTHTYDTAQRLRTALEPQGITVRVPDREYQWYKLGVFTHYTEHGHRMPGGGRSHPAQKAQQHVKERKELLGIRPDYVHFGHFHCYYTFQMTSGTTVIGSPSQPIGDDFTCGVINQAAGGAQIILPQHATQGIVNPRLVKLFPQRGDLAIEVL
jgi:hypothetical protein